MAKLWGQQGDSCGWVARSKVGIAREKISNMSLGYVWHRTGRRRKE
jgi:hypothetical protein